MVATPGGGYEIADGTSYSAPLVSGAAALLLSARPQRTADQLAQAIVAGTDAARFGFAHGLVHIDRSLDLLAPRSAPVVSSPTSGAVVSGLLTVTATSNAPRVRLGLADLTTTVTTRDGVASASFETYGLGGSQPVTAADCSAVDQCNDPIAFGVSVDNGAPTITSPAPGQEVRADSLPVTASAPGGAVRFFLDDAPGVTDGTAPYGADLSTERLTDGQHSVRAALCRSDGLVCDLGHVASVPVRVSRLHPGITGLSPTAISPDGDGRRDATTVTYRLDRRQSTALVVRDASGAEVYRRGLGSLAAGKHTAGWDGRRSAGRPAPDGDYTVQIATSDGVLRGLASGSLRVDRRGPALTAVHVSSPRVLPAKDGYLDNVALEARVGEALRSLRLEVSTRSGRVVRQVKAGGRAAGATAALAWDGRTASGSLSPGSYRVRLVAEDLAGNRRGSDRRTVTVTGQRLVRRSGTITVSARDSLEESFEDDCSQVFRRTGGRHDNWVAYASSSICSSADAYAAGDHQVRLRVGGPVRNGPRLGVRRPRRQAVPRLGASRLLRRPAEPEQPHLPPRPVGGHPPRASRQGGAAAHPVPGAPVDDAGHRRRVVRRQQLPRRLHLLRAALTGAGPGQRSTP